PNPSSSHLSLPDALPILAIVHRPLLRALAQREIRRPAGARRVEHLLLRRQNTLPNIRDHDRAEQRADVHEGGSTREEPAREQREDRKSTRLNSSHRTISY